MNKLLKGFKKNRWKVTPKVHKGMEPPQQDKYLLWAYVLHGNDSRYPAVIINGRNCRFTLISMNNTKVIDKNGQFEKDKSSERKNSIPPEADTHFMDAVDKRIWTKYCKLLLRSSSFVNPRL